MMTKRDAKAELQEMALAISVAATSLRPYMSLMREYERERTLMENVGPVLAPSLYMSSERSAADAIMWPIVQAAMRFVTEYEAHTGAAKAALEKVKRA